MIRFARYFAFGAICTAAFACSSSNDDSKSNTSTPDASATTPGTGSDASTSAASPGTAQLPPTTNGADVEAWLRTGAYKLWSAETAVHSPRSPSPHLNYNRIYSNALVSAGQAGTANWPVGAANVKELYANETDAAPVGYAVMVKLAADSADGANWYFYERQTVGAASVADGPGVAGSNSATVCVGCHSAAGSDAPHTPSPGGRDFVYTAVSATPPDAGALGAGTAQLPPTTNGAAVEAWLSTGAYKLWAAESAVHSPRSPSPHLNFNRIYSNALVSTNQSGTANWPVGAANVKELYAKQSDTTPVGFAVMVKLAADSAGGTNWYFYERQTVGATSVADGPGIAGSDSAKTCVGCHSAAGSDAPHTPSPGGRDYVYTAVPPSDAGM